MDKAESLTHESGGAVRGKISATRCASEDILSSFVDIKADCSLHVGNLLDGQQLDELIHAYYTDYISSIEYAGQRLIC